MTQYIVQSLNQWLLCGNGYFRVSNDIANLFTKQCNSQHTSPPKLADKFT